MKRSKFAPKGPKPAHVDYMEFRRLEMRDTGLKGQELNELLLDEWRNLDPQEKRLYIERYKLKKQDYDDNKDAIKAIGVQEFMEEIDRMRRSGNCPPEYEEDEVTKRIKRMNRRKKKDASTEVVVDRRKKARLCLN